MYGKHLRVKSLPVTVFDDSLRQLVTDLRDTMYDKNAAGLAAIQIESPLRVFVVNASLDKGNEHICINPEILEQEGEQVGREGCLSFPGIFGVVKRPKEVYIRYQDIEGNEHRVIGEDLLARVFIHEYQHLDGRVFTDEMSPLWRDIVLRKLNKRIREFERSRHAG